MKLEQATSVIERSGLDDGKSFGIKASGHAFKILSSGIYANKIGAVVRETACNAYDAHVAAGKKDIPIKIHMPTRVEAWYAVKDEGIGLSHEDIISLYTTYFESTKSSSNDFIGAFGLGSKSPFAYTDSFTVNSIVDKVCRCYTIFIDENHVPQISKFGEFEIDAPNGIEVQVPVKMNDIDTFSHEILNQLKYFAPLPEINVPGLSWDIKTPFLHGDDWSYYEYRQYQPLRLIQGNVAYPLDIKTFGGQALPDHLHEMVKNLGLVIKFEMGQLEVAASRETLSYTKSTVKNIIDRLQEVYTELKSQLDQKIAVEETKTKWHRAIALDKIRSENYGLFNLFKYNDKCDLYFSLDLDKLRGVTIESKESGMIKNYKFVSKGSFSFRAQTESYIFVADIVRPKTWIASYIDDTLKKSYRSNKVTVIYPGSEDIDTIIESIGSPDYVRLSTLSRPAVKKSRNTRPKDMQDFISIPEKLTDGKTWTIDIDSDTEEFPESGIYIERPRGNFKWKGEGVDTGQILRNAHSLGILEGLISDRIYCVQGSKLEKVKASEDWVNIFDLIREKVVDATSSNLEKQFRHMNYQSFYMNSSIFEVYTALSNKLTELGHPETPFVEFMTTYKQYQNEYNQNHLNKEFTAYSILVKCLRIEVNQIASRCASKGLNHMKEKLLTTYPLLNADFRYLSSNEIIITHLANYIIGVDKQNNPATL